MATPIKPSIYDTTHFNHEVTALNRKNPFSIGITTSIPDGLTDIVYEVKFMIIGIHTDSSQIFIQVIHKEFRSSYFN